MKMKNWSLKNLARSCKEEGETKRNCELKKKESEIIVNAGTGQMICL